MDSMVFYVAPTEFKTYSCISFILSICCYESKDSMHCQPTNDLFVTYIIMSSTINHALNAMVICYSN